MAKKKQTERKIVRRNSKTGKTVTITESQVKSAAKSAKKIYKNTSKRNRWIVIAVFAVAIVGFLVYFNENVVPLQYFDFYFKYSCAGKKNVVALAEDELKVHFIDVGQGDSIYVQFPDGKNLLIDAGDTSKSTYEKIATYLKVRNVSVLDYVILTHSDIDHVGGMDNIIDLFEVKYIYMPYITEYVTKAYSVNFLNAVKNEKGIVVDYSNYGDMISSTDDDQFMFSFLTPDLYTSDSGEYHDLNSALAAGKSSLSEEKNNVSPIILLEYAKVKVLFTGDAHAAEEAIVCERFSSQTETPFNYYGNEYFVDINNIDVLKVGHHGSRYSSSSDFLRKINPEYAVISVGAVNDYGHPNAEALERIDDYVDNSKLYMTKDKGDIVLSITPSETAGEKGSINFECSTDSAPTESMIKFSIFRTVTIYIESRYRYF